MRDYCRNNILSSIRQAVSDRRQSKYVQKVMGSVSKRLGEKQCLNFPKYDGLLIEEHSKQTTPIQEDTERHDKTVKLDHELPGDLTVDSGVITSRDETPRKSPKTLSFSSESDKVIEIEVEKYQPKYYDVVVPQKFIAHITETPKPQKVHYKNVLYNSTPRYKNGGLTKEVLKAANLIKDVHCDSGCVWELSGVDKTFVRSPSCKSMDDKFVVNLFESRQSKRWKRKAICVPDDSAHPLIDAPRVAQPSEPESHKTSYSEPWPEQELLDDSEMFLKLKKERDMECVKMTQASNVLKVIRKNPNREWSDELLAEKILLETDEKYNLLINKIRDLGYAEVTTPKPDHVATVTVSNLEFFLGGQEFRRSKYSDFFIMSLSHGTELLMSKATSPDGNKIIFDGQFTFANLNSDFNVVVKIFTIKLKTSGRTGCCSTLGKKTKNLCPMSKIYYENVNTYEMEASAVLRPSFACCGEFILTKDHIGSSHFILSKIPGNSRLLGDVNFSFKVNSLRINSNASGFLTLGLPNKKNEVLFWERKWCVLKGTKLSIYNYPSEEDFGEPVLSIDLKYCLIPLATNFKGYPRKRTFLLKTGRPGAVDDANNNVAFRKKSNFVLEKYFFTADSKKDFEMWRGELQVILNCLRDWEELTFLGDYY